MKSLKNSSPVDILSVCAAVCIPLFYVVAYVPYGMDTTDFGYFYGYAWRIVNGQIPYRDFYYIKPALPLFWHAWWLWVTPENIQMFMGKVGSYCEVLAASWMGALFLLRHIPLRVPLPLLATCGFVWGIHCFPAMPWHTFDGIFFASGGLLAASLGHPWLAGLLAGASALCKQSFLLVPFGIFLVIGVLHGYKALAKGIVACAGMICAFALFLVAFGAWEPFCRMTSEPLDMQEAWDAGLFGYLRQCLWMPVLAMLPWIYTQKQHKKRAWLHPGYVYPVIFLAWYLVKTLTCDNWLGFGDSWPWLFISMGGICLLTPGVFLENRNAWVALAASLLLAWSTAISGGYKAPCFFAVASLAGYILVHQHLGLHSKRLTWLLLVVGLFAFGAGFQNAYTFPIRPLAKSDLTYDAGAVYPKANNVFVDQTMLEKLTELQALRKKYGKKYTVLPGFTQAYYLNNDLPVYPSDWLIDWEINGETKVLFQKLHGLTVFFEKDQIHTRYADGYLRSAYTVPQMLVAKWKVIEETKHFRVYRER